MKVPRTKIRRKIKMKINFDVKLKAINGKELNNQGKPIILYDVCSNALLFNEQDEKMEGKEKLRRLKLARKIYGMKELVSIDVEDVALIKELVAKIYSTLITGQVWELLEKEN